MRVFLGIGNCAWIKRVYVEHSANPDAVVPAFPWLVVTGLVSFRTPESARRSIVSAGNGRTSA
jgi:hypothetical protein